MTSKTGFFLLTAVMGIGLAAPALAQHSGHTMPMTASPNPHAGHSMPMGASPASDPHAGHQMPPAASTTESNPHVRHSMPMGASPASDPHAGHRMPPAEPATGVGPHAGHRGATPASGADPHAGHRMGAESADAPSVPEGPPPAAAFSGPTHAADTVFEPSVMRDARELLRAEQGGMTTYKVMIDRAETRIRDGRDGYLWDAQGWYGGDIDKLWIKTEGEGAHGRSPEDAEVQALWGRSITPWFDFQAGVRYDFEPKSLSHLVLGLQGLAPYYFEVDAATFLSHKGDLTARVEAEYDQLITQKLVLQPRIEVDLAAQDVREIGIGAGLSSIEAGLRLRYEFVPEFAPYIGIEYERKIGKTARLARDEGEDVDSTSLVVGVRFWF